MGSSRPPGDDESTNQKQEETGTDPSTDAQETKDPKESPNVPQVAHRLAWLTIAKERRFAAIGLALALFLCGSLATSKSSIPAMEKMSLGLCLVGGLGAWFLPPHKKHRVPVRLITGATLSCVIYWLGPMNITVARARYDLKDGTRIEKQIALQRLVRLGQRNLSGVRLRGLNLTDFDLTHTNLRGVDFSHSTMKRAQLRESDLSGASLKGVNLRGADLRFTQLKNVNWGSERRSFATCDRFTQMPSSHICEHGLLRPLSPKSEK